MSDYQIQDITMLLRSKEKDKTHEKLFFDKDGKFLRKESCSLECCQGPVK